MWRCLYSLSKVKLDSQRRCGLCSGINKILHHLVRSARQPRGNALFCSNLPIESKGQRDRLPAMSQTEQILVYGDSLAWGIIPNTRERLPFGERWPGVLESKLNALGRRARVIEDCLNGRRTVWDDPFKPGRRGLDGLAQRIEINSPLSLVILMLGTNDFQFCHPYNNSWSAAQGVATLINETRKAPIEPGMPVPPILLVCPPQIRNPRGSMQEKFRGANLRCAGLADAYALVASDLRCHFFDAQSVASLSDIDGVHLDADQHVILGNALAEMVRSILSTADNCDSNSSRS